MTFYYRNNKPMLSSPDHFNVSGKPHLTSLKESHFNAGFHYNPSDGKSSHSLDDFFSEGVHLKLINVINTILN